MNKITVYHNPRCSKSRCALDVLNTEKFPVNVVEYLKEGISAKDLEEIVSKLDVPIREVIRKNEPAYKSLIQGKTLSDSEILKIVEENPILLERPLIVSENYAFVARPVELLIDFLKPLKNEN